MDNFYGSWKVQLDKTVGVAEVGKLFGWTEEKQQQISSLDYTLLIEASGDKTRCFLDYGAISLEFFFKLGEPFDYTGADGTQAKCTVVLDGGRLVESYVSDAGPKWQTERALNGSTMTATTTFEGADVKCIQVLVKV
uniref:Cytosolic fatty-acid binding proteins domain-containing protein n=1 Tax=Arion vulgaris TaxID=1028688 RepID=A0A0B7BQZ8_9EUPU